MIINSSLLQQQQTIQLPDPNSEHQIFIVSIHFTAYDCVGFMGTSAVGLDYSCDQPGCVKAQENAINNLPVNVPDHCISRMKTPTCAKSSACVLEKSLHEESRT